MDVNGSPEYALTWKAWDMPSGPPICALRASARRTSGKGFIGWPTPIVNDATGSAYTYSRGDHAKKAMKLPGAVQALKGWSTPTSHDHKRCGTGTRLRGGRNSALPEMTDKIVLKGWATPRARDFKGNGVSIARAAKGTADSLDLQCKLVCLNGTARPSALSARMDRGAFPLNPIHSLWLMGYPAAWDGCAPTATPLSRRSSSDA
jgi:hypothetical protein